MPKLYILTGTSLGQWITFSETPFYIGRTVENELVCQEAGVSRKHAAIEKEESGYYLKDMDSNNGTLVNGQKISRILLNEGDEIKFSSLSFAASARRSSYGSSLLNVILPSAFVR